MRCDGRDSREQAGDDGGKALGGAGRAGRVLLILDGVPDQADAGSRQSHRHGIGVVIRPKHRMQRNGDRAHPVGGEGQRPKEHAAQANQAEGEHAAQQQGLAGAVTRLLSWRLHTGGSLTSSIPSGKGSRR
ncbi:MAG: hypothetical protein PHQ40_17600 [Anaerolineaceae bacterium]|nr:hypothetical protein [Anaerolineaceae bacterium]